MLQKRKESSDEALVKPDDIKNSKEMKEQQGSEKGESLREIRDKIVPLNKLTDIKHREPNNYSITDIEIEARELYQINNFIV